MQDYRLCITSRGIHMSPREFTANSDREAIIKAKEVLDLQRKTDPEGTSYIVYFVRIDVREELTEIKIS